jgi:hypothetical protein
MKSFLGRVMSSDPDEKLERFIRRFFETHGAEVEKNDGGFEVLMPEDLAELLHTPEYIHLKYGESDESDLKTKDGYYFNYGSQLLDHIVSAACRQVPLLACQLNFDYIKSQGFDSLIQKQLAFHGSLCRVESWATIKTEYLYLTCRYLAQSDEQKEGLLNLVFNLETGAYVPEMDSIISLAAKDFKIHIKYLGWDVEQIEKIMEWVKIQVKSVIAEETGPFQESMNRRFRRDVANLEEYYNSLKQEMEKSLQRPGLSEQLIRDRKEKIALLPDELERKKDDLFKKYSIKVNMELCSAMWIMAPAVKVLCKTSVGRKNKNLSLTYNPVTKSLDPLVCQGCKKSTTSIYFCDDLHLLCPDCSKKCPVC